MRFSIVGHATLYVETERAHLLVDPWLFGSCYWRSWWHYPPISDVPESWLAPEYLYLTHHHFDHFHYPTLRRVDRNTHILVPEVAIDFMDLPDGINIDEVRFDAWVGNGRVLGTQAARNGANGVRLFLTFDPEKVRKYYEQQFAQGTIKVEQSFAGVKP